MLTFNELKEEDLGNIVGKGDNVNNGFYPLSDKAYSHKTH